MSSGSRRSSAAVRPMPRGRLDRVPCESRARSAWASAGQGAQVGPAPEQLIDLPHQRPGPGQVAEREVDAGELDPGLNSQLGHGVGQQMPQPLSADEFLARRRDISPVHSRAGLHRADQGRRVALLDPGLAQTARCLIGKRPRPGSSRCVPSPPATARTARPRESSCAPTSSPMLIAILEGRVATIEVTAQDRARSLGRNAGAGVTMLSAAHLRTASSASARICSIPRRHMKPAAWRPTPRRKGHRAASHPRTASDRPRQPIARPRLAAPSARRRARPARRPSGVPRSRPGPPATGTTAGRS